MNFLTQGSQLYSVRGTAANSEDAMKYLKFWGKQQYMTYIMPRELLSRGSWQFLHKIARIPFKDVISLQSWVLAVAKIKNKHLMKLMWNKKWG